MDLFIDRSKSYPISKDINSLIYQTYSVIDQKNTNVIDELTPNKLQNLAEFSKNIEKPSVFGEFNNKRHYLDTLRFVLSSTHETRNRILFCLNEILPQVPSQSSMLDVGPGDGTLTKKLAPHFKNITLVDNNHHALNYLQKLLPSSLQSTSIIGDILNVNLKSNHYNLAVLSHMLYYIEPTSWFEIIKSVYQSLKNNGLLVIILGGDELGKSELIQYFGGQNLEINPLAIQCQKTFGLSNVKLYASDESFVTCTHEAMLHILGFMLADAKINALEYDLNKYITQKLKYSNNHYEMTTRQKYIIIKKNC